MTERLYQKYSAVKDFVNKGKLPKTKEETLAIADVFFNLANDDNVTTACKHAPDIFILVAESHPWKEGRETLRQNRELCREVIRRLVQPNLTKIQKKDLIKLKK